MPLPQGTAARRPKRQDRNAALRLGDARCMPWFMTLTTSGPLCSRWGKKIQPTLPSERPSHLRRPEAIVCLSSYSFQTSPGFTLVFFLKSLQEILTQNVKLAPKAYFT